MNNYILHSFSNSFTFIFLKSFWNLQNFARMKYIFAKDHQVKTCLLFRCCHAVVIMQILNLTNQYSLFKQSAKLLRSVRMTTHPTRTVTHARDHWWTSDFANALVFLDVNSRAEIVPSPQAYARNGASRLWLGDKVAFMLRF
jgi:hypothetical protein